VRGRWAHEIRRKARKAGRRAEAVADRRGLREREKMRNVPVHMQERLIRERSVTPASLVLEIVKPSSCL